MDFNNFSKVEVKKVVEFMPESPSNAKKIINSVNYQMKKTIL